MPSLPRRFGAEFFGTFWLVFAGVGSVVIGAAFPGLGFGYLGVAFAFGLTVLTMAYAVGPISGAHLNPAVSIGLWAGGRFRARDLPVYIAAQVLGGLAGASVLYPIATGIHSFTLARGFGSNGYGSHSPGGYALGAVIVAEIVLTAFFVLVIHGATDKRAPAALAPLAIGLTLTLVHLVSLPVDGTSVNPARSLAPAIWARGWAVGQVWVFIVFPIVGGVVGGLVYRTLLAERRAQAETTERAEVEAMTDRRAA